MTELPLLTQPYPDNLPWVDLSGYLDPTWTTGGPAFYFRGLLDGNTAHIHLRTRRGKNVNLTDALPDAFLPPGQMLFPAHVPTGAENPVSVFMEAWGQIRLYTPRMNLVRGDLENLVLTLAYTRKAV